jgi:integrase
LKRDQKEAYIYAQDLAGSTPLVTAIKEWKKAKELTAGNLIPAAQAWHDRQLGTIELFDVNEIIKRFKVAKERAGIIWRTNYQKTFPGFQNAFGKKIITTITTRQLQDWLDTSFAHPTTRNTHRKRIVVLWRWARSQNYLPRQVQTEAELTERAKEPDPKREIIKPQVYRDLLSLIKANHPHYLPALVLAGFCGLRPDEVHHQVWEDIKLDQNILKVTAAKAGTAAYRHVPICNAAIEWILLSPKKRVEKVCSNKAIDRIRNLGRKAGIKLPANCFRHSFVSYRVVQAGSIDQTAQEAGNSPRVIHKHYRELVTKEEAKDWFSIRANLESGKVVEYGLA